MNEMFVCECEGFNGPYIEHCISVRRVYAKNNIDNLDPKKTNTINASRRDNKKLTEKVSVGIRTTGNMN